jgi:hypothetical protein
MIKTDGKNNFSYTKDDLLYEKFILDNIRSSDLYNNISLVIKMWIDNRLKLINNSIYDKNKG